MAKGKPFDRVVVESAAAGIGWSYWFWTSGDKVGVAVDSVKNVALALLVIDTVASVVEVSWADSLCLANEMDKLSIALKFRTYGMLG